MDSRGRWWLLLAAMVIGMIALARGCSQRDVDSSSSTPTPSPPAHSAAGAAGAASTQTPTPVDSRSSADRTRAMYAAAATLQRYLAAVGGDDPSKADAFWTGGHPPANSGEADLRSLKDLTSMRIESGTPLQLDADAVPSALEIPVQLRVGVKGEAMRKYEGRYRLRRKIVDDGWEVTSASIDAIPSRQ